MENSGENVAKPTDTTIYPADDILQPVECPVCGRHEGDKQGDTRIIVFKSTDPLEIRITDVIVHANIPIFKCTECTAIWIEKSEHFNRTIWELD